MARIVVTGGGGFLGGPGERQIELDLHLIWGDGSYEGSGSTDLEFYTFNLSDSIKRIAFNRAACARKCEAGLVRHERYSQRSETLKPFPRARCLPVPRAFRLRLPAPSGHPSGE